MQNSSPKYSVPIEVISPLVFSTTTNYVSRTRLNSENLNKLYNWILCKKEILQDENQTRARSNSSSNIFTETSLPKIPPIWFRIVLFFLTILAWYRVVINILILSSAPNNNIYVLVDIWFSTIHMLLETFRYVICWSDVGMFCKKSHNRNVCGVRTVSLYTAKSKQSLTEFILFNIYLKYSDVFRLYFLNVNTVIKINNMLYWNVFISTVLIRFISIFINYYFHNVNLYSVTIGWNPFKVINRNKEDVIGQLRELRQMGRRV